jgi:rhodanese-related sulfurtransferase
MNRIWSTLIAACFAAGAAFPAFAYDAQLAASYAKLFAPAKGAKVGKQLHLMQPEAFVDAVKRGETLTTLDVRTPDEARFFGTALPGTLSIPVDQLFLPENLERIPTGNKVVVFCKSGTRGTAVGTALRHIGFDNVYVLKGGLKALSSYLDPKNASELPKTPGQERTAAR